MSDPVLIVGLGNPGAAYRATRHNAGAMVVRQVAETLGVRVARTVGAARVGEGRIGRRPVVLGLPQTFMNASGEAVGALLARWPVPLAALLVVCDDAALPFGTLRLRPGGSDGGHRGLRSVQAAAGGPGFPRLRVGIACDPLPEALEAFVLAPFAPEERRRLPAVLTAAAAACVTWVREGMETTMTRYNRKVIHGDC